ncbi:NAD(P)-binding domain-containing protein [Streptomyces sp. RS10V-4]|uniref:NAD(P)-dependent oxidoreductase n=1 Tax=Streptomyces rhizoryzae TaxID=2932493 RepID=UPI00200560D6|nr:NAD(P)-binding domain-containing protein [Streptomyces rhizoryzae]MCK7622436.1 NAD(P)-binding domain-containing protein [Streptomyces rhizoryzae]
MSTPPPVTVLGLGPIGQAITRTLLTAGHPVTVWNRTPSRAADVVAAGARLAATPAEALAASDLVILSLTDYRAMWDILGEVTASLAGRTLANLSSDTPDATREAASWAQSHGAAFLTGGVMVPGHMIGTDRSYVFFSGDEEAFGVHRATLAGIGEPRFLGEDPGRAQLMYQAHLDVFLTTLSGFAHATALVGSAGITAEAFLPEVMQLFRAIPDMIATEGIDRLGRQIDSGAYPGDRSTITMMGASADHIQASSEAVGIDTALPRAVQAQYHRALADGHGADGWARIIDGIRTPRREA